ncbi:hypothetical protein, partial [Neisseria sicca]|uniref:hypothetical protein n=1 Tax=Neisseria sicca TaxID=490 RepID=UPI001C99D832
MGEECGCGVEVGKDGKVGSESGNEKLVGEGRVGYKNIVGEVLRYGGVWFVDWGDGKRWESLSEGDEIGEYEVYYEGV